MWRPSRDGEAKDSGAETRLVPIRATQAAGKGLEAIPAEIDRLSHRQLPQYLSRAQVQALIEACRAPRITMLVKFLWGTGARVSEAISLRWQDCDLDGRRVRIVTLKRHRDRRRRRLTLVRSVPISPDLTAALAVYRLDLEEPQAAAAMRIFRFTRITAYRAIVSAASRAGIVACGGRRVSPHILRHSYAVNLLTQGVPLPAIQELLGHSWVSNTLVYTRIAAPEVADYLSKVEF